MKHLILFSISILWHASALFADDDEDRIQPYSSNEWYWQYNREPIFLIGGSDDDNLFQWQPNELEEHLDLLTSVGGNFLRNVMSTRDEGNLVPYTEKDGHYELAQWNEEYWRRLDHFLQETAEREIIVQLTLWDQHDFVASNWNKSFWNPRNNGIGLEPSRLHDDHAFFSAVEDRNALILPYQTKYVEKVLQHSLKFNHVVYNITNEGWAGLPWEVFWAEFIHEKAKEAGKRVEVTTMEHGPELSVDAVLAYPTVFSYIELSQNNNSSTGYDGYAHWEHMLLWRERIARSVGPRPMMNEKIYGSAQAPSSMGDDKEAERRFWRIAFAGCSSARFHRPTSGLGLGERAQLLIRAMRMLANEIGMTRSEPAPQAILSSANEEAYCLSGENGKLAVYLPEGGSVTLEVGHDRYSKRRLSITEGAWSEPTRADPVDGALRLELPQGESSLLVLTPL